jgi:hypothetical protein
MKKYVMPVVILLLLAGFGFATEIGGKNKIRYDRFDWKVYQTPHFQIHFYDRTEPRLEKLASYAESSYDELARRLNYQVNKPIVMVTYATHAEFEQSNVIISFIPEGVGAFATPVRNRMVLPLDLSDRELHALIQHELTHIFQYEILFQGRRGRIIHSRPPLWFMEGMASFYARDESARDRAYLRDAALSNMVPSIAANVGGFYAYRYGHMVFEYIEDEWGDDGVRDFVMAFRNSLGGRINRPFRRIFNMDAEEFDSRFHAWLRKQYQPYTDRGMPDEFGRRFKIAMGVRSQETSPVASPSGDLIAAVSTYKDEIDVVVFGVPDRRLYKNLTKGYSNRYDYLVAQGLSVGPDRGRDLAFSPDGNYVAVIGRTERTRSVFILDVHSGGIERQIEISLPVERLMQPTYSPDGTTIAFQAYNDGRSDIYLLDLSSEQLTNLTNDELYDSAPVYDPDGKSIVYSSNVGEFDKLVRISLDDPSQRAQLTQGPGNDEGAAFSADGKRVYFASDRDDGVLDIFQYDLESQQLRRITHVIGIAINPVPVQTLEGERVIFQAFSRGVWDLFIADPNDGELVGVAEPADLIDLEPYVPSVSITVDPQKAEARKKRKYFIENAGTYVGVDQDSNFISDSYIVISDNFGDRRFAAVLRSIANYTDFYAGFMNLEHRIQWGVNIFDQRMYFLYGYTPYYQRYTEREELYRETGAAFIAQYPITRELRAEGQIGYMTRDIAYPLQAAPGSPFTYGVTKDNFPFISLGLVGDTSRWKAHGPHAGSRWELQFYYAPDMEDSGALSQVAQFEGRKYFPTSARSELALRLFAGYADGSRPQIFAFGGLDTMRGVWIRSLSGNRAAYLNAEWRFPIFDRIESPFIRLRDVRGYLFADAGAAWYEINGQEYNYLGELLENGFGWNFVGPPEIDPETGLPLPSTEPDEAFGVYGIGFSFRLMGLPMRWEFYKQTDFKDTFGGTKSEFWVGYHF